MTLRKLQPAIRASAVKIAATRTGLGILIGPPLTIGLAYAMASVFSETPAGFQIYGLYRFLSALRVLVWALIIYLFMKQIGFCRSKLWTYAALGAVWSCLLDLPGFGLAIISPGQVPFC
jgi:hypothetical protein